MATFPYLAKIFPFPPNWSEGVTEKIVYPTDVMPSFNETEQRVSLVGVPWKTISFRALFATALDAAKFDALVYGWQHKVFGVPWWPQASFLTAGAGVGATELFLNTARMKLDDSIYFQQLLLLWASPDNWEYAELNEVDSYDVASITMKGPLLKDWPEGTMVIPVQWCRMSSFKQPTDLITDAVAAADLSFDSAFGGILAWDVPEVLPEVLS